MDTREKIGVIIPAAGSGQRMGFSVKKQFLELKGEPILYHTLKAFFESENLYMIVVVAPLEAHDLTFEIINKVIGDTKSEVPFMIVEGGETRQESVYKGIKALSNCQVVIVHDGVRPFVNLKTFMSKISLLKAVDGISVGQPVIDTIKRVKEGLAIETLDRSELWSVQTPQAFKYEPLIRSHEKAIEEGFLGTDDASLLEKYGYKVQLIEGQRSNIKITTPFDLVIANAILEKGGDAY